MARQIGEYRSIEGGGLLTADEAQSHYTLETAGQRNLFHNMLDQLNWKLKKMHNDVDM